jgi:nucleoside-diphosphate-sugar epimerase
MKKISILGIGWLGKPLALSLIEKGYSVKGSTTTPEKIAELNSLGIEGHLVDITSDDSHKAFLDSEVLLIMITSKDIAAFQNLIQQIEKSPIQKVLFVSSTSVYPMSNSVVNEDHETLNTPLFQIEELFRNNTNFKTTILRFSGLFGGQRHPSNWFRGGRIIPRPEGFVNFIHQDDCIGIIEQIIAQDAWNTTFNGCNNSHPTRREFYTYIKKSKGMPVPIFDEESENNYKIIGSTKVQEELGYVFKYDDMMVI